MKLSKFLQRVINICFSPGFYGEQQNPGDGSTIVQKDHTGTSLGAFLWDKFNYNATAIFVIRNPFEVCITYWAYNKEGHTGLVRIEAEDHQKFAARCLEWVLDWQELAQEWLPLVREGKVRLVIYEDLKQDPINQIREVVDWLNIGNLDPEEKRKRLVCLRSHLEGKFKRQKSQEEREKEMAIFDTIGIKKKVDVVFMAVSSLVKNFTLGRKTLK